MAGYPSFGEVDRTRLTDPLVFLAIDEPRLFNGAERTELY